MEPIVRRTITITITETWTITWSDGRETVWAETHEVVSPADSESAIPQIPLTHDDQCKKDVIAPEGADPEPKDE